MTRLRAPGPPSGPGRAPSVPSGPGAAPGTTDRRTGGDTSGGVAGGVVRATGLRRAGTSGCAARHPTPRGVAPARSRSAGRLLATRSEEGTAQATERGEERDPCAAAAVTVHRRLVRTRRQLPHQQRRLGHLSLGHGGSAEHREMTVEPRTRRAAPAGDGRHSRPAAHCYLFHVTPHPYKGTRPRAG